MQTSLRTTLLALTLPSLAFGQDAAWGDEVVANSGLYLTVEYVEDDDTQIQFSGFVTGQASFLAISLNEADPTTLGADVISLSLTGSYYSTFACSTGDGSTFNEDTSDANNCLVDQNVGRIDDDWSSFYIIRMLDNGNAGDAVLEFNKDYTFGLWYNNVNPGKSAGSQIADMTFTTSLVTAGASTVLANAAAILVAGLAIAQF